MADQDLTPVDLLPEAEPEPPRLPRIRSVPGDVTSLRAAQRRLRAYMAKRGWDPLEYLVDVASDPEQPPALRVDCTTRLLSYLYPTIRGIRVDALEMDEGDRQVTITIR